MQYLLNIVPPPTTENIWEIRSNDDMTLLDAAQEMKHVFPAMFEFVEGRTLAARQNEGNAPALPPVPAPIPIGTPISLEQVDIVYSMLQEI